ncbi:MAG: COG1683: Uncharacterized conserved protein / FIG143828: Hypothetical protein YbgA [uncultured Sulfurovum sp.]|uniref:DUF1722 domain-containing protein n=1 Tax=uncultured Sulfurovum sp. TaxID=269237 RepID=A0A6S6U1P9_9BACT|nr:MAG: COG1683: Uncharacterized conserved protein / FIG143828: Hypothetical protein YbgA [uncultured Sulfurovum sp.]
MKIAVSACLLGEKIRFDGGHKHDRFITKQLGEFAQYVPFCPEHLAFGTPRPTIRLVEDTEDSYFVQSNKSQENVSKELLNSSQSEFSRIQNEPLRGIILKSKSPSCGLGSALVYRENGYAKEKSDGMFAKMCREQFPLLPMEEEGRLNDPWLRENFVMQLFAYDDFENLKATNPSMKELVAFHQSYKFMLQAKNDVMYRELGQIVGNHDNLTFDVLFGQYEVLFKTTIAQKSSIRKNRNVLEHMAGFVKDKISDVEKEMLHEQIREYADKIVPLIAPLSRLYMFAKNHEVEYLVGQKFLNPYPKELALRSDIKSGK